MSVSACVAVDRGADRSRYAGHGFETLQSRVNGEIDEGLQGSPALDMDRLPFGVDSTVRELEHDTPETRIGNDQIRATADYDGVEAARVCDPPGFDETGRLARFGEEVGWSADPESRIG